MQDSEMDECRHLWDGSDPGWRLDQIEHSVHRITFQFGEQGPSHSDVVALRRILDDLRDQPMNEVWHQLRGTHSYTIPRDYGNLEMKWLVEAAENAGLSTIIAGRQLGGYIPIAPDGSALRIEDDEIAQAVAEWMIAAGVPVGIVHVD